MANVWFQLMPNHGIIRPRTKRKEKKEKKQQKLGTKRFWVFFAFDLQLQLHYIILYIYIYYQLPVIIAHRFLANCCRLLICFLWRLLYTWPVIFFLFFFSRKTIGSLTLSAMHCRRNEIFYVLFFSFLWYLSVCMCLYVINYYLFIYLMSSAQNWKPKENAFVGMMDSVFQKKNKNMATDKLSPTQNKNYF